MQSLLTPEQSQSSRPQATSIQLASFGSYQPAAEELQAAVRNAVFEQRFQSDGLAIGTIKAQRSFYFFFKRVLDFALASIALVVLLPVLAIIALLIAWDSPGSIFFMQERVGAKQRAENGQSYWRRKNFTLYKFRTMRANAGTDLHRQFVQAYIQGDGSTMNALQPEKDSTNAFKLNGDPRVTQIGKFLRKTSLDELPQLLNVMRGDISLVGPRPAIPYEVDMYRAWHIQRLETLPGLTGLWQVKGRDRVGFDEMVKLDIEYVQTQSLWQDIQIIFATIPAVLLRKGSL